MDNVFEETKERAEPKADVGADAATGAATDAYERPPTAVYFNCLEGNISHYYHFFFGALIPLTMRHLENLDEKFIIVSNIGPFKQIFNDLFPTGTIVEYRDPILRSSAVRGKNYWDEKGMNQYRIKGTPKEEELQAYDIFREEFITGKKKRDGGINYDHVVEGNIFEDLYNFRGQFSQFIEIQMPENIEHCKTYEILLIERSIDPYFVEQTRINESIDPYFTSGSQRRYIRNHQELSERLEGIYGSDRFGNIILEGKTIFEQYQLFKNAKIIIAQHGAALANIYFCNPTATIIEVTCPWENEGHHFRNLSKFLNLKYLGVRMKKDIDYVDIPTIIRHVGTSIASSQPIPVQVNDGPGIMPYTQTVDTTQSSGPSQNPSAQPAETPSRGQHRESKQSSSSGDAQSVENWRNPRQNPSAQPAELKQSSRLGDAQSAENWRNPSAQPAETSSRGQHRELKQSSNPKSGYAQPAKNPINQNPIHSPNQSMQTPHRGQNHNPSVQHRNQYSIHPPNQSMQTPHGNRNRNPPARYGNQNPIHSFDQSMQTPYRGQNQYHSAQHGDQNPPYYTNQPMQTPYIDQYHNPSVQYEYQYPPYYPAPPTQQTNPRTNPHPNQHSSYREKYIKYKNKYIELKKSMDK